MCDFFFFLWSAMHPNHINQIITQVSTSPLPLLAGEEVMRI